LVAGTDGFTLDVRRAFLIAGTLCHDWLLAIVYALDDSVFDLQIVSFSDSLS